MEVSEPRLTATSFADLALPLFDQLYNFAHWLTQDRAEAEDLVQETYAKALKGFSGFQPGTNFRAWIFRILRNAFLTSRTGLKSPFELDEDVAENLASATPSAETALVEKANRELVQQALTELSASFREILLLCDVEEMSYEEIAQVLAIPVGTVMSRLHRARKARRQRILSPIELSGLDTALRFRKYKDSTMLRRTPLPSYVSTFLLAMGIVRQKQADMRRPRARPR
jgi:RNA polymerase sigma-70 factor (ECF subfamily)